MVILIGLSVSAVFASVEDLKFNGFIADEANLLSPQAENDINLTLLDLKKKTKADIAVVTLPTLNGKTVEETALYIGRTYKLGDKVKNNGVVFLTALQEREVRIELGTGLENRIRTGGLRSIINDDVIPYFKKNDYENGIIRGSYNLALIVGLAEGATVAQYGNMPPKTASNVRTGKYDNVPWWMWPIAFVLAFFTPRRRRGLFNSGSFGGFGGGGGFGGCGASGRW